MASPLFRFAQSQPQQQTPMFSQMQQQSQPQQHMQAAQASGVHIHLFTTAKMPVSYQTKWADLSPESQQLLLNIEERVQEYREESRRLEQRERIADSSGALHKSFEHDAARISQELSAIGGAIEREAVGVRENQAEASVLLLRQAEVAVRSFLSLRPRFIAAQTQFYDFYSGLPGRPSPFLQQTVARFENQVAEYRQRIEELERLLLASVDEKDNGYGSQQMSLLQSLPTVMTNVHDFFIHVAAEVESLHQHTGAMRSAFLSARHRRGDDSDPFVEAERRAVAQRDAAAKRIVHPTLHLPLPQQTPVAASAPSPAPSSLFGGAQQIATPQTQPTATTTPPTQSLFGSTTATTTTPSFFGATTTPAATPASTSSLFGASFGATTATPAAGSTPAASGGLFGTPTPAPTANLFGTPTPAPSTGGLFGAQASTPAGGGLFGTPATGAATGLFGTAATNPPAFGAASNPPAFGANPTPLATTTSTAAPKAKPRGTRRK